ncbi:phage antirepressor KilAC domain-containing protein [Pseudostreptobacillus hongkongensis]|uniref:phage antirepressor KilAC domain-containing protein n=1 Tax=Pseudostreptobacillus hongkongensis TaxID=1162717 RepID=UPI000829F743|nr:phage antirepressor KilAC domain-containing protein [Pseudostreptobacillus hongkongensis]
MQEMIKIDYNDNQEVIVSGRELHEKLEIQSHYKDWIKRMLDYGFEENRDFIAIAQKRATAQGNETTYNDHLLKLDTAKEICMLQRNEKGKIFRQYFIQIEKDYNSPEKVMARALMFAEKKMNTLQIEVKELQDKIEADKPKIIFAEALEVSDKAILIGELAKILKQNGIDIGQNRLFEYLRKNGYLCNRGEQYNSPTQRALELKLFEIKTTTINNPDGSVRVTRTTKVTPKGQSYFINQFKK